MLCPTCRLHLRRSLSSVPVKNAPSIPLRSFPKPPSLASIRPLFQSRVLSTATPRAPPPSSDVSLSPPPSSETPNSSSAIPHFPSSKDLHTPTSPAKAAKDASSSKKKSITIPTGSVPGGAVLKGIGYLKAKPEIYALEDSEYPGWLWSCLDASPADKGKGKGKKGAEEVKGPGGGMVLYSCVSGIGHTLHYALATPLCEYMCPSTHTVYPTPLPPYPQPSLSHPTHYPLTSNSRAKLTPPTL
jgi:hypothetical protein